jgi:hypothetical protein
MAAGLRDLTPGPSDDITPNWSPDDTKIAVTIKQAGNVDVDVVVVRGGVVPAAHPRRSRRPPAVVIARRHHDRVSSSLAEHELQDAPPSLLIWPCACRAS